MIEIKFNYFIRNLLGGGKCQTISLTELSPGPTNEKTEFTPCIQTYDCGFRRDNSHGDYSMWNGTVFIDIDSKKFYKEFNYKAFRQGLVSALETYYPQNYCMNQTSGSGNSVHIVLYFDCERNETNFLKACQLASNIIIDCGKKCGEQFVEILNYSHVIDTCTTHVGQPLYISAHKIHLSNYLDLVTGECNLNDIELVENEYTEQEISFNSKAKYKIKPVFDELPDYEYHTRWRLLWIILNYFQWDYNKCKEIWSKIIPLILQHRDDYDDKKLFEQFERDYKTNKGKQYAFNSSILQWTKKNLGFKFEIKRKFEPQNIDLYKADVEYNLKEDEYLSSVNIKFRKGFNHIFAGCGVGKTRFGIELGNSGKKVLFITPLTSININSFGKLNKNWLIVDGSHKDEVIHICGTIENALKSKWSICTTWESFSNYKMYEYDWDYIILDESHCMYMYDYRVRSIQKLKASLNEAAKYNVVIMMSGTPSFEIEEFDCYKIKINKEITHIPCELVFYNEQYKGYVMNDIKEWTEADKNNLAVVFYDKTNYHTEEDYKFYGLDIDIFNKNFRDNTEYILNNENVKKQITGFSVYGQAGINIYIDTDKKVRMYILNTNALGIIQYANRIRNKEVVDKVVIPYKIERIENRINKVDEKANFEEAHSKIEMINAVRLDKGFDSYKMLANDSIIKLRFGLPVNVLDIKEEEIKLNEPLYETWNIITHICEYESQIQLIYNRLITNQFDVETKYLDEDIKDNKTTRMRSNQFAGQMLRFDFDKMVKKKKYFDELYLDMTKQFEKIAIGNTKEVIEEILNYFWNINNDLLFVKEQFTSLIEGIVKEKETIKKIDLVRFNEFRRISRHFHEYVDNAFLYSLLNPKMSVEKASAAYVRFIWNDKIDWKAAADETYEQMNSIKKIVSEYRESFAKMKTDVNPVKVENDDKLQMIYTYIIGKHASNRMTRPIIVNGIRYESMKEAAEKLGKSISWVKKYKQKYE